jgi:hypothetical protein
MKIPWLNANAAINVTADRLLPSLPEQALLTADVTEHAPRPSTASASPADDSFTPHRLRCETLSEDKRTKSRIDLLSFHGLCSELVSLLQFRLY